ncbi:serine hydrolase domain-containing protein [Undibacterium sp. Di26W]|uniref:serine hydrolase domain-containing protein n=1 Tax=Undibacterium sp. Di26W TaxID=3413035 RepID=UPI003BF17111
MASTAYSAQAVFPGKTWEELPADKQTAACRQGQAEAQHLLEQQASTALLLIRDGRVLFSYGRTDVSGIIESARKSILSMLYGKYVDNAAIDLDQTLAQLGIDDVGGLLDSEKQARARDLLTARSGVFHAAANTGDDLSSAPARGSQTPGSYFLYNNWDFNVAGTILENATHKSVYQLFDEDIAQTLQLQDFQLNAQKKFGDTSKSRHLPYHFLLSTRDMARLGYLALHQGNWNGRQLIPVDWMHKTTSMVTPSSAMHPATTAARKLGYGYMWWVLEEPANSPLYQAYMAWGLHGQYLLVIPRLQMVIAHQRKVPVDGKWDVPKVGKQAFFGIAATLAGACQQ